MMAPTKWPHRRPECLCHRDAKAQAVNSSASLAIECLPAFWRCARANDSRARKSALPSSRLALEGAAGYSAGRVHADLAGEATVQTGQSPCVEVTVTGDRLAMVGKLELAEGNPSLDGLKPALAKGLAACRIQRTQNAERIRTARATRR